MEDKEFQTLENNEIIINANDQKVEMNANSKKSKKQTEQEGALRSFEFVIMLCAISCIVFSILAHLFIVVNSSIMFQIFTWISGLLVIGGLSLYAVNALQTQKININKKSIIMIIALAFFVF